jgi:predicted small lipoprotein YifL
MKNLLKLAMIVSFVITLSACGRMGDLVPVTETENESETAISSTD